MNNAQRLTIIIVSYNTRELLKQTLRSIPHPKRYRIVVVENNSSDGSLEMLKSEFPGIEIIRNAANLGFARANNLALKTITTPYVMLLNSDTQIVDNALEDLIEHLETHRELAAVTPQLRLPDGAIDLACHRGMPTPLNAFCYFTGLESLFPTMPFFSGYHMTYLDFETPHTIAAASMTALLIRTQALQEIGLLDERFFFYAEDLDWCKRAAETGWYIGYFPQAKVIHHKSQSGKAKSGQAIQVKAIKKDTIHHFFETMKLFYDKHYVKRYPGWMRPVVFMGINLAKFKKLRS